MMEIKSLQEIASLIRTGKTPPTKEEKYFNGEINWYSPGDLDKTKYLFTAKRTITQQAIEDKKAITFPKDTLLVGCIGDIGKLGITSELSSSNQQLTGILPNNETNVSYLYYWFKGNKKVLENYSNNAVVPILNNRTLETVKIPLPPLDQQKKIAAILDAADAYRQKTKALIEKYDELTQSLFLELFGDPVRNPKGWEIVTIRDIITEAKYGTSSKADENGIYSYLRMNNITYKGHMDYSNLKYINVPDDQIHKYETKKGDILFNRTNSKELVGKTGIIATDDKMILAGYLIRLRMKEAYNPYFLWSHLNSKWAKITLKNMCKSIVGMANINAQELQNIKVVDPPMDLQNQFADSVQAIEAQKVQAEASLAQADHLFNSLLQRAFKGELV